MLLINWTAEILGAANFTYILKVILLCALYDSGYLRKEFWDMIQKISGAIECDMLFVVA